MQRIQSFLLFLVIVTLVVANLVPIWSKTDAVSSHVIFSTFCRSIDLRKVYKCYTYFPYVLVGFLNLMALGVATYELFKLRNRRQQIQLGMMNTTVLLGMLGLSLYFAFQKGTHVVIDKQGEYQLGFWLIIGAIVSNLLANHFIKKDESRVRSADRIR